MIMSQIKKDIRSQHVLNGIHVWASSRAADERQDGIPPQYSGTMIFIRDPFSHMDLIPVWVGYHMPSKVWDEITYPFPAAILEFGVR